MKRSLTLLLSLTSFVGIASVSQAQLVTSAAGITGPASVIDFSALGSNLTPYITTADPNFSVQVGTPVGRDVRMSYTTGDGGLYAGFPGWGLSPSGDWTRSSIGVNQFGTVRYSFMDGPVSGVGVLMNYANCCISGGSVFIRSLDVMGNVITQVDLLASAPIGVLDVNEGEFRGFQYNTASVYAFEVGATSGGASPIMTDLTFTATSSSVVPEPSAVALMAVGLAALGLVARKRRQS